MLLVAGYYSGYNQIDKYEHFLYCYIAYIVKINGR